MLKRFFLLTSVAAKYRAQTMVEFLDDKLGSMRPPVLVVWGVQHALTPIALGSPRFNEAVLAWLEK